MDFAVLVCENFEETTTQQKWFSSHFTRETFNKLVALICEFNIAEISNKYLAEFQRNLQVSFLRYVVISSSFSRTRYNSF